MGFGGSRRAQLCGGPGTVFFHRPNLLSEFSDGHDGGIVAHHSAAPRPGFSEKSRSLLGHFLFRNTSCR